MSNPAESEPVGLVASIKVAIIAVLAVLVSFGVVVATPDQVALIGLAVEAVLAVPAAIFVRSKVTANKNVQGYIDTAKAVQKSEIESYLKGLQP